MIDLLTFLPKYLYSKTEDTQHAHGYDPYLRHPSKYGYFQNYIPGLIYHDNDAGYHFVKQLIDVSLSKQYATQIRY